MTQLWRPQTNPWQKPDPGTQLNTGHPLAQRLELSWLLNDGPSSMLFDSAGQNHAQLYKSCTRVGTSVGAGLRVGTFNTVAGYALCQTTQIAGPPATQAILVTNCTNAYDYDTIWCVNHRIWLIGGNYNASTWTPADGEQRIGSTVPAVSSEPTLVVHVWTKGSQTLYVKRNSVSQIITGAGASASNVAARVKFGASNDGPTNEDRQFWGTAAWMGAWSRALSVSEVSELWADMWGMYRAPRRFWYGALPAKLMLLRGRMTGGFSCR